MLVVAPHRRFVAAAAFCVALVLCALAPEAMAAEDARFEVRSAYLEPVDGVMQLNATLELGLSATALEALRDAMPYMSMLIGWLVPMIWAVWGFGLVCLVGLAVAAHWLTARHTPVSI